MTTVTLKKRSFSYSGIQLCVNTKFSHSIHEGGSVDTQADCSAISATDAALARRKSLYNFLLLLPFIFVCASIDFGS
jgi:hypothetical protein